MSSLNGLAHKSVKRTTFLDQGVTLGQEKVFEGLDFCLAAESLSPSEGVLTDEQVVGETSQPPGRTTVGEQTSLECVSHEKSYEVHKEKERPLGRARSVREGGVALGYTKLDVSTVLLSRPVVRGTLLTSSTFQ